MLEVIEAVWRTEEGGFSQAYRRSGTDWRAAMLNDLLQANVVDPECRSRVVVNDDGVWRRGGAETFIVRFSILQDDDTMRPIIAKAMTSSAGGSRARAEEWISRSSTLEDVGISTATYGCSMGTVYQDWIEDSFKPLALGEATAEAAGVALAILAARIGQAGFRPVTLLPDLRWDGSRVCVTNLGSDLGASSSYDSTRHVAGLLVRELGSRDRDLYPPDAAFAALERLARNG